VGTETVTLRDVMTQPVITATPETSVCKAAQQMAIARVGCVLIVDADGLLIGVFTERDLLRMFTTRLDPPLDQPVAEHMSLHPLTLDPDVPVATGRRFMKQNRIGHLPLVESGRLVGLVSVRDLPSC
jgi:CBS domain-containing protein